MQPTAARVLRPRDGEAAGPPDPSALGEIAGRYGLEVDRESIPRLTAEYGLHIGPPPAE